MALKISCVGTESGNPQVFIGQSSCEERECQSDLDCAGLFEPPSGFNSVIMRTIECSEETHRCRAILEFEDSCYVNNLEESQPYDCSLSDQEIFQTSKSDPNRPPDIEVFSSTDCP